MMTNLLLDDRPILVMPKLAEEVGLNEAIVLQQVHYWLQRSTNIVDDHKWVYNSFPEWNKQFPWWGIATVKRTFSKLENEGYLITANYNKAGFDKTKWYRINYDRLHMIRRSDQFDTTMGSKRSDGADQFDTTNTIDYTETTTETNYSTSISDKPEIDYVGIVSYLNESAGKNYRSTTPKTRTLIRARFKEGFNSDDFKKVIDNKVAVWKDDQKMNRYLRPETLFGTKFESYLNDEPQQPVRDDSYTYF